MEITSTSAPTLTPAMVPPVAPPRNDTQKAAAATSTSSDATSQEQTEKTEKPSDLKSFTFGLLDLDKPEEKAKEPDSAYSAGKWVGAAAKVGALVSFLI